MRQMLRIAKTFEPGIPPTKPPAKARLPGRPKMRIVERTKSPNGKYYTEKLACGHSQLAFDNLTAKLRVCKKCAPQPKPVVKGVLSIVPTPEIEDYRDETSLEKFVRQRQEAEAGLRAIPPIPLDWLL